MQQSAVRYTGGFQLSQWMMPMRAYKRGKGLIARTDEQVDR
jgi:hypothetical protein